MTTISGYIKTEFGCITFRVDGFKALTDRFDTIRPMKNYKDFEDFLQFDGKCETYTVKVGKRILTWPKK